MKESQRKCMKCGSSPGDDPNIKLYRFPRPGVTNMLRCELWAKYCFPDKDVSLDFQIKLYSEHRMLCDRHFRPSAFIDFSTKSLHRGAYPEDIKDIKNPLKHIVDITALKKAAELRSVHTISGITADSEHKPEKLRSSDGEFSWQKETHVISCGPETDDYPQDVSMYADDSIQTIDSDGESDSENYVCNECNNPIKGGRFACAQCVDYDLCAQCAGERAAHRQHYLLRVPPRRPPDEVQIVLETIRSMLENSSTTVSLSGNDIENQQTDEIKTEIKNEVDLHHDPLDDVVEELEENCKSLKRIVPHNVDVGVATKRMKPETQNDDSSAPLKSLLWSRLVGKSTATSNVPVPSNVMCEDEPPATLIIGPSMTKSLMRPTVPVVTNTISQAQTSITAIRAVPHEPVKTQSPSASSTPRMTLKPIIINAKSKIKPQQRFRFVTGVNKLVPEPVAPEVRVNRPVRTLQTVPVIPGKAGQKKGLLIENMQIRVVTDQSSSVT